MVGKPCAQALHLVLRMWKGAFQGWNNDYLKIYMRLAITFLRFLRKCFAIIQCKRTCAFLACACIELIFFIQRDIKGVEHLHFPCVHFVGMFNLSICILFFSYSHYDHTGGGITAELLQQSTTGQRNKQKCKTLNVCKKITELIKQKQPYTKWRGTMWSGIPRFKKQYSKPSVVRCA